MVADHSESSGSFHEGYVELTVPVVVTGSMSDSRLLIETDMIYSCLNSA
jgi:hypothetical protein